MLLVGLLLVGLVPAAASGHYGSLGTDPASNSSSGEVYNAPAPPSVCDCTPQSCGGRKDIKLYRKILRLHRDYNGLFKMRSEIWQINQYMQCQRRLGRCCQGGEGAQATRTTREDVACPDGDSQSSQQGNTTTAGPLARRARQANDGATPDLDRCCQTVNRVEEVKETNTDYLGDTCYVVILNGRHQFAHVGTCASDLAGECQGECTQKTRLISLLCLEPNADNTVFTTKFKLFSINSYCSCQSSSG